MKLAGSKLPEGTVDIWRVDLARDTSTLTAYELVLDEHERTTAAYFRSEVHRERFVIGRGTVRRILAEYLARDPKELRFRYGSNGKPELEQSAEETALHFNFTHSQDRAVLAVTELAPIGVDLECVRAWSDLPSLEKQVFTTSEIRYLASLGEDERRVAFYRLWTIKEALLKATGTGLSVEPRSFAVDLASGVPSEGLFAESNWKLVDVSDDSDWPATLAIGSESVRLRQRTAA